jgi:ribosomal protein L35
MRHHFKSRWDLDKDLYKTTIENHIAYLKHILRHHSDNYRDHLRRGVLIPDVDELVKIHHQLKTGGAS